MTSGSLWRGLPGPACPPNVGYETVGSVHAAQIAEAPTDFNRVYDPTHPDANEDGYVQLPNVDMVMEILDAIAASQAFSSNVTTFSTLKSVGFLWTKQAAARDNVANAETPN